MGGAFSALPLFIVTVRAAAADTACSVRMQGMSRPVLDAFYCFAFAVCRDPGKKHLQVRMRPFV